MVLLPAVVLKLPAYQCLVGVESAEQAQSRQAARVAQLARMSAVRLVSARVMLLRVSAVPVETWGLPARLSALPVGATWGLPARMTAGAAKAARAILTRTGPAPTLVPLGVSPPRVERPSQPKAPP
jgi:hypothetical protein